MWLKFASKTSFLRNLCVVLWAAVLVVNLSGNPFLSTDEPASESESVSSENRGETDTSQTAARGSFLGGSSRWIRWTADFQKTLREGMTGQIRRLRGEDAGFAWLILLGVSFLYGMIHALGPGHRKTVLASYFLAHRSSVWTGLGVGMGLGLLHGGSAILLISTIYFFLKTSLSATLEQFTQILEFASYALISVLGILFLVRKIIGWRHPHAEEKKKIGSLAVILFSGWVPCPGASLILVFSLSMRYFSAGIAAALAMSAGMGVALSLISMLAILMKNKAAEKLDAAGNKAHIVLEAMETLALLAMTLFGILMLPIYTL